MLQPKKPTPRVLSGKRTLLHNRRGTPRPQRSNKSKSQEHSEVPQINGQSNVLQLPPINKSENVMSASPYQQHSSGGMYLATSSLLQAQNQLQVRRNRGLETKQSVSRSDYGNNLTVTVNKHSRRRSQQHNLPAIVSTSHSFSDNKKINDSTENSGHLLDMNPRQNSDYREKSSVTSEHYSQITKNSREDLSVRSSKGVSVISTPNIATAEYRDSPIGKEEPDFSSPPNPMIVPSKEATTFTLSQICQERVRTPVGSSQNRYRVSGLILDDDRPKTSPDELTEQEKAAHELCDIVSDTKWHRQKQQQTIHCSNSQSELLGDLPVKHRKNENNPKDFLQEKRSRIDLTLPLQSSLIDVRIQSPRYGRRSVMLPAAKNHDVEHNRVECDVTAMHQMEPNLAHSVRHSRQLSSSGHGSVLHPTLNTVGQLNQHTLSLSQELAPQALPLVSTKKQSTVRSRCSECRKRLNITNVYTCRCDKLFCAAHRYSELHNCTFDYKNDGRKILERTNPLVTAQKLPKI
ncbi:hypothetical protein Cfor_07803 [Coptotermes formosanus]|jgi:AN1-type zinc finger and ubiquitin domain-containing protein 1|uniref:AN1-type domain-containing protein n=1 Tax=Coptotermes formosanus TaxID=36987 RepID=A0A6L2PGF6_COPFO|nr:hypothetical protein Cfor_07803 [Coptotermes formosanus]